MNILVIPEDFRKDQYILKPIITAILKVVGKPTATVRICQDPLLGGYGEALKWERIQEILERYKGMVNLFLLCVDRDGEATRKRKLENLEKQAAEALNSSRCVLFAENAWQELEVWVLAGHDLPSDWSWQAIRNEVHPKEMYFEPFAKQRNLLDSPEQGRKPLAEEAARRYDRIRRLCPEDIAMLEDRIHTWIDSLV